MVNELTSKEVSSPQNIQLARWDSPNLPFFFKIECFHFVDNLPEFPLLRPFFPLEQVLKWRTRDHVLPPPRIEVLDVSNNAISVLKDLSMLINLKVKRSFLVVSQDTFFVCAHHDLSLTLGEEIEPL